MSAKFVAVRTLVHLGSSASKRLYLCPSSSSFAASTSASTRPGRAQSPFSRRPFLSFLTGSSGSGGNSRSAGGGTGGSFEGGSGGPGDDVVYYEERVMPYSPPELYAIVADVPSYPSFLPFLLSTRILPTSPSTPHQIRPDEEWEVDAEMRVGFWGFQEGYTSRVRGRPFESVEAIASETPLFKTLVTTWSFHPLTSPSSPSSSSSSPPSTFSSPLSSSSISNHPPPPSPSPSSPPPSPASDPLSPPTSTRVSLSIRYAFNAPSHAAASRVFLRRVSGLMVGAFEKRVEGVYGRRKAAVRGEERGMA